MNLIVARGINGEIGANNRLLWNLPGELANFKALTTLNTVVMGRKTWESIGRRVLPQRLNIVITRNPSEYGEYLKLGILFLTLEEFIEKYSNGDFQIYGETFVIGGEGLYTQLDRYINVMYITEVEQNFPEADSFFYGIEGVWDIEPLVTKDENGMRYTIYKHTRRK